MTTFAVPVIAVTMFDADALAVGLLVAVSRAGAFAASIVAGAMEGARPARDELRGFEGVAAAMCLCAGVVILSGAHAVWILALFNLFAGALGAFYSVAHLSTLPQLVGRERIAGANARLEAANVSSAAAGPALAGAISGVFLVPVVFLVAAAVHLLSILALSLIRAEAYLTRGEKKTLTATAAFTRFWRRARDGYRYVFVNPILRLMTVGNMLRNFALGFLVAVETIVVLKIVGLSEIEWGIVFGSAAVVGFLATFLGRSVRDALGEVRTGTVLGFLFPVPLAGFALAPAFPEGAFAIILCSELLLTVLVTMRAISVAGTRARVTPDERLRGANAANRVLNTFPMPIGAMIGGALAVWMGEITMTWVSAALMLIAAFYSVMERAGRQRDIDTSLLVSQTGSGC